MFKMKKIISLLLAVLMVMSTFTVMSAAVGAVTFEDTKLYFDLSSTGWELGAKDKVGFYVFSNEHGEELKWGGKKLLGTDEGDGIWSYDPAAKGMNIIPGEQYKIIFTGAGNQTYDLIFDTTCYGHVAYCDDTIYENPVDSSKQTRAAFWKDMDATKYGPVLQISSIGTVVGTCPEEGKTPVTIFEDFLTNTLANARTYMVDTGNITEQELIDNIGEGLGLTKDEVAASIASTSTESTWSADDSALPGAEEPTEPAPVLDNTKLYFDVSTTGWDMGAKDKVGFYVHSVAEGEEISWGGKKLNGVDEGNGIWSYEPNAKGMTINDGVQYQVIFTGAGQQTADLFFDTTCFGHCAYCNGEMIENTVDSSKKNQVALWKDLDPADYGPVKGITSLGNLVGTCLPQGETDESLFTTWLTDEGATGYANAMKYTVEPGKKTEQQLIDDLAGALELTKEFVEQAIAESGIESAWTADASSLPTGETPTEPETQAHTHTPGVAVYENEVVTHDYIKRDLVTYCTECGEELSRKPVQLPILTHSLNFVDEVPATYEADGVMAHYECCVCGELFSDEQGRHWVSAADLVIPKLTPTEPETAAPETETVEDAASYYVVGNFSDWTVKDEYKMVPTPDSTYLEEPGLSEATDYVFEGLELTSASQFKIVRVDNWSGQQTWNPDGMGNNYGENGEITAAGSYDVYFYSDYSPNYGQAGTFYGCIYVDGMPAPTETETTAPVTEAPAPIVSAKEIVVTADKTTAVPGDEINFTVTIGPVTDMANITTHVVIPEGLTLDESSISFDMVAFNAEYDFMMSGVSVSGNTIINDGAGAANKTTTDSFDVYTFKCTVDDDAAGILTVGFDDAEFMLNDEDGTDLTDEYTCKGVDITVAGETPTEPETEAPAGPEYYVVGNMNSWAPDEAYKMTLNDDSGLYELKDMAIELTTQFKVVKVEDGSQTWYPDGMGNNYGENGEITAAGTYTVLFDPNLDAEGEGWFYNCIKVKGMPAPTEPETQAIETISPEPGDATYYIVGGFTDWQMKEEYAMTKIAVGDSIKYLFEDLALTTTDQFKVVSYNWSLPEPVQTWYPDGMGNNYGENGEITADGTYDVYFDPAVATDGWFYSCIYVDGMNAPTQPATEIEPTEYKRAIDSMPFVDDVVAEAGITDTFTVYFKMPTSGEHSWANEYNELDGVNWAGIYWWQGSKKLDPWPGAKMTLVDAEQGIFSANVPYEPDELTNIIFNNAVDGGTDKTAPQYAAAQQTVNVNCQGAEPEEFDTIPEGTPTDNFDGCIFICKPAEVTTSEYSGKETFFGDWYFYYGDGCYGMYAMNSDHFTYVDEMCCNPDHHHDPLIPTEPESKDGYYVVGNFTNWEVSDDYKMTEGDGGIYTLVTDLTTLSRFKIVKVEGENVTWIPDGIGSDYVDIPENGTYTVCFDPAFAHTDWYFNCITVELNSHTDFMLGDVDGDGDVTVVDATFIQRYATYIDIPGINDQTMMIVGDVDGDGDVTPVDATLVMRYATLVPVPYDIGKTI